MNGTLGVSTLLSSVKEISWRRPLAKLLHRYNITKFSTEHSLLSFSCFAFDDAFSISYAADVAVVQRQTLIEVNIELLRNNMEASTTLPLMTKYLPKGRMITMKMKKMIGLLVRSEELKW
jgi:hypothetical protein